VEVRPKLLKKVQAQVLMQKWSGENDIKLFRNWIHAWLAWMLSSSWKGPAFNKLHVQNLSAAMDGNMHDLVMHYIRQGVWEGVPIFCVRACLRPGMCYILVLTELQHICGMDTQGDKSLLDAWAEMR